MMKSTIAALALVAALPAAHAQQTAPTSQTNASSAATAAAGERMTVVYVSANKISVKPGNGKDKSIESTKYTVTADTIITVNGAKAPLAAIKAGHKVVIVPAAGQPDVAASISMTRSSGD